MATTMIQQKDGRYLKSGTGNISARIPAGTYTVSVNPKGGSSIQQVVAIKARESKTVTLALKKLADAEPVSSRDPVNLVVDTVSASFLDTANNNLYHVGPDGSETLLDSTHNFVSVRWSDPSYGIAQDKENNLYVIEGAVIQPLDLPSTFAKQSDSVSFSVSGDRTIYVSDGNTIFRGAAGKDYRQVYQPARELTPISLISVKHGTILAKKSGAASARGDSDDAGEYIVIDESEKAHTRKGLTYVASLSPDGKYIALSGNSVNQVFDTTFKKVIDLPTGGLTSPDWLNDYTVVYGVTSALWKFDIHSGHATQLANLNNIGYVSQTTVDQAGKYVYMRIQKTNGSDGFQLERVSLTGRPFSSTMVKLSVFLPNIVDACSLGYENFTKPTVVVHGSADLQNDCILKAQDYLRLYNVKDPTLNITFSPAA